MFTYPSTSVQWGDNDDGLGESSGMVGVIRGANERNDDDGLSELDR